LRITTVRKISQVFFLVLFLWLCIVTTLGTEFHQLRGWPVNWFLQLDPLVAVSTVLTTHRLYRGLAWALAVIIGTILFGRFFCGWICPFGTMHHFFGWMGRMGKKKTDWIRANQYRKAQSIKYFILVVFLFMAIFPFTGSAGLQTGLLDPIPFVYRSTNIVLLPLLDRPLGLTSVTPRFYEGAWIIGILFLAALLANFVIPRFYCRFLCPLGALLGILCRVSVWRIAKKKPTCSDCRLCDAVCEGACHPWGSFRVSECVLCFNCLPVCPDGVLSYRTRESAVGEIPGPDMGRRGFLAAALSGVFLLPLFRLGGRIGPNWHHKLIRPPGALPEAEFLERCIKCGQCMRICPTNIIVPGGLEGGVENLWTPVLNFRSGTSGCQLNCTACSFICPTAAIRPITLSEKLGLNEFAERGPIRIGTAFVDRSRCLPWSMDTPCIVCQENCPMTPKAIFIREEYRAVRDGIFMVSGVWEDTIILKGAPLEPDRFATGDYYCSWEGSDEGEKRRISRNSADSITLEPDGEETALPSAGERIRIVVRLQQPVVDVSRCIGCGTCEHECPVSGKRAIRVSGENESRSRERSLLLKGK